jgi:hypothetical protein
LSGVSSKMRRQSTGKGREYTIFVVCQRIHKRDSCHRPLSPSLGIAKKINNKEIDGDNSDSHIGHYKKIRGDEMGPSKR